MATLHNISRESSSDDQQALNHSLNVFFETRVAVKRNDNQKRKQKEENGNVSPTGTAPVNAISNLVYKFVCKILKNVHTRDKRFITQPICMGSYYQRLKVGKYDDFDYNVRMNLGTNLRWSYGKKKRRFYGIREPRGVTAVCDDILITKKSSGLPSPKKSEVFLGLQNNGELEKWMSYGISNEGGNRETFGDSVVDIVPLLVRRRFGSLVEQAVAELNKKDFSVEELIVVSSTHGPATTLKARFESVGYFTSIDLSPIVEVDEMSLPSWPRPGKRWPSSSKVTATKKQGLDLIPKSDFVWSLDTVKYEKQLLKNIDKDKGCRKKSQMILKKLKEYWSTGDPHFLRSYCLKNALYWECEQYPNTSQWPQAMLAERVLSMANRLLVWLRNKRAPWYFWPEIDIMGFTDNDEEHRKKIVDNIENFLKDPIGSLQGYH